MIFRIACMLLFLAGCAAPGSGIGSINFTGQLIDERGVGVPNKTVRLAIPPDYGLGGLDRYGEVGKPADSGRKIQSHLTTTDQDGRFNYLLSVVYHKSFWIFPPLGFLPKRPPTPYGAIFISEDQNEGYLIQFRDEKLDYSVHDIPAKKEKEKEKAKWRLSGELAEAGDNGWSAAIKILANYSEKVITP